MPFASSRLGPSRPPSAPLPPSVPAAARRPAALPAPMQLRPMKRLRSAPYDGAAPAEQLPGVATEGGVDRSVRSPMLANGRQGGGQVGSGNFEIGHLGRKERGARGNRCPVPWSPIGYLSRITTPLTTPHSPAASRQRVRSPACSLQRCSLAWPAVASSQGSSSRTHTWLEIRASVRPETLAALAINVSLAGSAQHVLSPNPALAPHTVHTVPTESCPLCPITCLTCVLS